MTNRRLVLAKRLLAEVSDDCFDLSTEPVRELAAGQVLVHTMWLGFEPAQRGSLNDIPSYREPVAIGR